jgi:putative oxidoreductase
MKKFIVYQTDRLIHWVSFGQSPILLIIRLWLANIFFRSGYVKITNFDDAILLFTNEHPVPFLPPLIAAILGTFFELVCSSMLILGFGTRLACIPLLMMTAVIEFTYMDNVQHYYWAMLSCVILFFGAGAFSIDRFILAKTHRHSL